MEISPQVLLFILFMLAVVQTTRLDEMRQRRREVLAARARRSQSREFVPSGSSSSLHL